MVKKVKITNAQFLKTVLALDKQWQDEHDGEELLTKNTRETIENVIETSTTDEEINRKFNKMLRSPIIGE